MEEKLEDCSWQEVYRLNGVMIDGEEDFDRLDLEEIDTIVIGFNSSLNPFVNFKIPEIIISR
jgi:hypothetical protein